MAAGRRIVLVLQAYLVWANRGQPAYQRFIDTGDFGDASPDSTESYNPDIVRQIVASGNLV